MVMAFGSPAFAGPKDKSQETLVNPDSIAGGGGWDNKVIATKVKSGKCKLQIQAKDATGLANTDVICLAEADVRIGIFPPGLYGNSIVLAGTIDANGKLKIKANLAAVGCGGLSEALALNGSMTCYAETLANYDGDANCPFGWIAPDLVNFNADSLVGLCQGGAEGDRITPPAQPILAEQGSYQPLL
jgi:hypothetical protein